MTTCMSGCNMKIARIIKQKLNQNASTIVKKHKTESKVFALML